MDTDRILRARELFLAAAELPESARRGYLNEHCEPDGELRALVDRLLQHAAGGTVALPPGAAGLGWQGGLGRGDPERPGAAFGDYLLLEELGHGGMGVVWLAEQKSLRRRVALKLLRPGFATPALLKRFEREAEILGRLQHPGIAHVYEVGTAEFGSGGAVITQPFFAMEYIRGQPIDDYVRIHQLGVRQQLSLFANICDAVEHAHHKGVIHRDLKPDNIFVTEDGEPKILDFGVARVTDSDVMTVTMHTAVGDVIGTVPYMSPEQVLGDPTGVDARSDVYSLGVVLFQLLSGRLPVDVQGRSIADAARIIRDAEPRRLGSLAPVCRGDVDTIVHKAIDRDRHRRYRTVAELAADVRRTLADEPIVARPASAIYRARKWAHRHPAILIAFVLLTAGLVASTWFATDAAREVKRRRALGLAQASAQAADSDQTLSLLLAIEAVATERLPETLAELHRSFGDAYERDLMRHESMVRSVCYSPDGALILTATQNEGANGLQGVQGGRGIARLFDREGAVVGTFSHGPGVSLRSAAFSPAGDRIVTASGEARGVESIDPTAKVWKLDGTLLRTLEGHTAGVVSADFSSDGRRILTASEDGAAKIWDLDGRLVRTLAGRGAALRSAIFSPAGDRVLTAGEDGGACMWDAGTGEPLRAFEHHGIVGAIAFSPGGAHIATGCHDSFARVWTIDGRLEFTLAHGGVIQSIAFAPAGDRLVTGCTDGKVRVFDRDGKQIASLGGHDGEVLWAEFHPDPADERIVSASADGTVRVWDLHRTDVPVLSTSRATVRFELEDGRIVTGAEDGTVRVSSSDGTLLRVWDTGAAQFGVFVAEFVADDAPIARQSTSAAAGGALEPVRLVGHTGRVTSRSVSTDGEFVITSSADLTAKLWDRDGIAVQTYSGHDAWLQSARISHDGRWVLTASGDGAARVFDRVTADLRVVFVHPHRVTAAAFSYDDRHVLTVCSDGKARLFGADDPSAPKRVFSGHEGVVAFAAMSRDGRMLATASRDDTARLWDVETGALVSVLRGHRGVVRKVAFSRDGRRVVTTSGDNTARVWIVDPDELIQLARARVVRDFTAEERTRYADLLGR